MIQLSEAQAKERIARRVAATLPNNGIVNLGVGIPTMAVDFLSADKKIYIQTENGMLGVGPSPRTPEEFIPNLINASRSPITEIPGSSYFDSATSFAMIRSGRMDATVIGAIQVSETGDLANWALPGKGVLGPGGAMDLVVGVKDVIVATLHTAKGGKPKLVPVCTLPLTALKAVNTVITEFAVFKFIHGEMVLVEHSSDVTLDDIKAMTTAHYFVAVDLKIKQV
ncbi:MAG: atoA [Firmicutes bacterium]|nr:atoA [Bacillota bacterium]